MLLAGGMFLLKIVCFSGFLLGPRSYGGEQPRLYWLLGELLVFVGVFVLQMPRRCGQLVRYWEHLGLLL